jgi:hypothetical protein
MKGKGRANRKLKQKAFRVLSIKEGLVSGGKETLKRQAEFLRESIYFFARD